MISRDTYLPAIQRKIITTGLLVQDQGDLRLQVPGPVRSDVFLRERRHRRGRRGGQEGLAQAEEDVPHRGAQGEGGGNSSNKGNAR